MENWENILAGYLEGTESRADAEALRWKIHLAAEVREEVEAVLRLADEVAAAIGSVAMPDGAVSRLRQALHGQSDWLGRAVPAGWSQTSQRSQLAQLAQVQDSQGAAAGGAGEDAVNALIEGTAQAAGAAIDLAGADEDLSGRLEQARTMTTLLSDFATRRPPEGAVDRLVSRLRAEAAEDAGSSEAEDGARQFLARLKVGSVHRPQLSPRPDVLAASAEHPETDPGAPAPDAQARGAEASEDAEDPGDAGEATPDEKA